MIVRTKTSAVTHAESTKKREKKVGLNDGQSNTHTHSNSSLCTHTLAWSDVSFFILLPLSGTFSLTRSDGVSRLKDSCFSELLNNFLFNTDILEYFISILNEL